MKNNLKYIILAGLFIVPFIPFLTASAFFFPFITTKVFAWRVIVEIIFAVWLLLALREPEYRPKKSLVLYAVGGFLAIIGLANLFGADPSNSFWSNFERMEGYISLLHLGAYFLVLISVMSEELWRKWWNTSLVASALMAGVAIFQIMGWVNVSLGGARVDGTFGNPIYLAVYSLFHIFIALLFLVREWRHRNMRWFYGALILLQLFVLYHTATRGAILGLIGGVVILGLLNLRGSSGQWGRKVALGALLGSLVLVGGLYLARNTAVVSESPVLSRFSTLSLDELRTQGRYFVWPIAWSGFTDRPLLGWGQENFDQVFQKYYVPEMHILEPWFDRAHNIFLDWLVSGGVLGLISYLALYVLSLYLIWWRSSSLSFADRSILTALLATYFFHNFFVFDHLVSYILFFSLLAYIHSHSAEGALVSEKSVNETWLRVLTPVIAVAFVAVIYVVNWKPMMANVYLIEGFKSTQLQQFEQATTNFEKAYRASTLGRTEVVQHTSVNSLNIFRSSLPVEKKNEFYAFVKSSATKEAENYPNSAKVQLMAGSFLSSTGAFEEALVYLERARELMPGKQQVYFELANVYINNGDDQSAIDTLQYVGEISPVHKPEMDEYIRRIRSGEL